MILNFNELIKKYNCNINGVLHVGAHHGEEYKLYKQFDINPIVFIEALPHTFKKLKENVGEECICINTAIGNINGNVSMYVESKDAN
jgi:FkbM family methyltransferase